MRALETAYADKGVVASIELPAELLARGDERDFMEILGNLLENAFKYTRKHIHIGALDTSSGVGVYIDDDGPGVEPELRREVMRRGARADEVESGQGIGLSVVAELVALYQGDFDILDGALGGARVCVSLPAA